MKKAQFWYGDFLIAVLILMVIGVLFVSSITDLTSRNEILKDLTLEASDISSVLMTEGSGSSIDWQNRIGTVGFMANNKFDSAKFDDFLSLSYEKQKYMLGTFNNIGIYLKNRNNNIVLNNFESIEDGLSLDENSLQSVDDISRISNNLVHIKRFVFYDENNDGKGDIYILGVVVFR